jgi:hypothetical protein
MLSRKIQKEIERRLFNYEALSPDDPTEAQWLAIIDETVRSPKRWSFYRQWYKQRSNPIAISLRLHCDKRTLYRWREELFVEIALKAAYLHLLEL